MPLRVRAAKSGARIVRRTRLAETPEAAAGRRVDRGQHVEPKPCAPKRHCLVPRTSRAHALIYAIGGKCQTCMRGRGGVPGVCAAHPRGCACRHPRRIDPGRASRWRDTRARTASRGALWPPCRWKRMVAASPAPCAGWRPGACDSRRRYGTSRGGGHAHSVGSSGQCIAPFQSHAAAAAQETGRPS